MTVGKLRILATTDLHMQLFPWNYSTGSPEPGSGLLPLKSKIEALRENAEASLLLDNGDFLQGTLISGWHEAKWRAGEHIPHPMISAFDDLSYDAVGIGNHEFDLGLDYLSSILAEAPFPCLGSNLQRVEKCQLPVLPWAIIPRRLGGADQTLPPVKIGLFSVLPKQTENWNRRELRDEISIADTVAAAKEAIAALRLAGTDLIIALCHGGIEEIRVEDQGENTSLALAELDGIDAMIAGHTHLLFPGEAHQGIPGVDARAGTLNGIPTVMPGSRGTHLGEISLQLRHDPGTGWHVSGHKVHLHENGPDPLEDVVDQAPAILRRAHDDVRKWGTAPLGHSDVPLQNYFAPICSGSAAALMADAQLWAFRQHERRTRYRLLPLISAVAPMLNGGHARPEAYVNAPAGPISRATIETLFPFKNTLQGLILSGAQIRDWLEQSVSDFATLQPGAHEQRLLAPNWIGHNFDTLHGLKYQIDLSIPSRPKGSAAPPRIRNITHEGRPLRDDGSYLLITNDYRGNGGGGYVDPDAETVTLSYEITIQSVIEQYLQSIRLFRGLPVPCPFEFVASPGTSAVFATGPGARAHMHVVSGLGLEHIGRREDGFDDYRAHFPGA